MNEENTSLAKKYAVIADQLNEQVNLYVSDIAKLFPELKKSSLYWTLSNLTKEGYLKRVRKGVYSLNEVRGKSAASLSDTSKKISAILEEEGYSHYISGIDVVMKFMQHIPEDYPSIVFIEKAASSDIIRMLKGKGINVIKAEAIKENGTEYTYSILRPEAVVFSTSNFDYAEDGIAYTEKAFIDLFYAITREGYPMPLQELGRTYSNMVRLGAIDQKKMITISYKRNLQYDIRYIVENKYLSEGAKEIVKYI